MSNGQAPNFPSVYDEFYIKILHYLKRLVGEFEAEEVTQTVFEKIKESAMIGQFVKDQPAYHMKEAADNLLGTHLLRFRTQSDCPIGDERKEGGGRDCESDNENESCGCMA